MITVQVRSFIKEIFGEPCLEIEIEEGTTVKELLMQLVNEHGATVRKALLNPKTGEIYPHFIILVNGKETFRFPEGTNTPLKDSDTVSILMLLAGG